jgi:hypothetical protein
MGWSSSKTSSGGGSGGVQSVTGLNTQNFDPANPVVQISVDNVTIVGDGTPAVPLSTQSIYGSFNSTIIQNLAVVNVGQRIQMENTIESNGISVVGLNSDALLYSDAGLYQLNVSIQFNHNTGISVDNAYVWLNYNGSNINSTTRQVILRPTFPFLVLQLSYIVNILNDGDTITISWTANSTDIELYFQSAGTLAPFPDIPSVIVNSFRI